MEFGIIALCDNSVLTKFGYSVQVDTAYSKYNESSIVYTQESLPERASASDFKDTAFSRCGHGDVVFVYF